MLSNLAGLHKQKCNGDKAKLLFLPTVVGKSKISFLSGYMFLKTRVKCRNCTRIDVTVVMFLYSRFDFARIQNQSQHGISETTSKCYVGIISLFALRVVEDNIAFEFLRILTKCSCL